MKNLKLIIKMKKIITTTKAPAPIGPYNQAVLREILYTLLVKLLYTQKLEN